MTMTMRPPPPLAPLRWPHRTYPGTPAHTAQIRADLRTDLHGFSDDLVDTITLCASELFANAIEHTASGDEGEVLRALDQPTTTTLRLTIVDDGHSTTQPAIPTRDPADWLLAEGQRGLLLVSALAHNVGSYHVLPTHPHHGRAIWALFPCPSKD